MKHKFKVIVTCVGGRLIYDIIMALRDASDYEIEIIGTDVNENAHGRLLCDSFYVVPSSEDEPNVWLEKILKIDDEENVDIIIPLSDGECRVVAENKDLIQNRNIKTSVGHYEHVMLITDKFNMMSFLRDKDINTGPFFSVNNKIEASQAIKALGYPNKKVVFKPRYGRGSRGVLICDEEKTGFIRLLKDRFCGTGSFDVLCNTLDAENIGFQDYLAMPHYNNTVSDVDCLAINGSMVDISVRLRQLKNPLMPTSTGHKIYMDQRIIDYAETLCSVFNIHGPGDFDIVIDDNEEPLLLDAGSRFSGSVGGAYTAGKNMLAQLIRVITEMPLVDYNIKNECVLRPYITMAEIPSINEDDYL